MVKNNGEFFICFVATSRASLGIMKLCYGKFCKIFYCWGELGYENVENLIIFERILEIFDIFKKKLN